MNLLFGVVDRLSRFCGYAMMVVFLILVSDMMYEVVSRRVFDRPTLWAYDIAYMSNAAIFMVAAGYALLNNEHIRIDFLSTRMPARAQDWANAVVYTFLLLPALWLAGSEAVASAWSAFVTGELEPSSPWKPVIWPYYSALALGLVVFALQAIVQIIRHVRAALGHGPTPLGRAGGSA
jgi:TRAP-type mannitol/chloroaromatic compound transport system permease small subunit